MADLLDALLYIALGFIWAWVLRDLWTWSRRGRDKRRRTDDEKFAAEMLTEVALGWEPRRGSK